MKKLIILLFIGVISVVYADDKEGIIFEDDTSDSINNFESESVEKDLPPVEVIETYEENMNDGNESFNEKNYNKALGYYMEAFKEKKDDIPSLLGIASSYEKMMQDDKALGVYRKILKISPKNKFAKGKKLILEEETLSGMSYSKKEDYFEEFEIYIKREGYSNSETIYTLGKIYMNDKSFERAYNIFRKDRKGDYRNYFGTATSARLLGNYDTAIKYYNETLESKPDFYQVYMGLGTSYQMKKSYDKAIENFRKSLKHKDDPNIYVTISNIYMAERKYDEAQDILEEGRRKNPNNKRIKENLAEVYRILKTR